MHYYTFRVKDYISKTSFLEPLEDIAYRRMLDHIYLTEEALPSEIDQIAMLIRMRSHTDCIANVLRMFFVLTDDGYINDKAQKEIEAYHCKSEKAKASANARWSKKSSKDNNLDGDANALQPQSESNANHKPITNNQEPYIQDKPVKFVFKNELIKMGAEEKLASEWLVVRKNKKASNTETAFNTFVSQVEKSGLDVNTVLKICIVKSWSGFNRTWVKPEDIQEHKPVEKQKTPVVNYVEVEGLW